MKTFLLPLRWLGVVSAMFAMFPLSATEPLIGHRAGQVTRGGPPDLRRGMTADKARKLVGAPDEQLGPDLWVYWNCIPNNEAINRLGYDTLIVAFAENCVSVIRLVEGQALRALIARLQPASGKVGAAVK